VHRRGRVRIRWIVTAAALAVVTGLPGPAGAVDGPVKIVGGPEDQLHPSVDDTYLIWTQNSEARPNVDHAYGKVLGEDGRFRLDATGRRGAAGGIDPQSGRAIYQQMSDDDSDLYWFDLDARDRTRVVADGVNTDRWERDPRVSAAYLFFARDAGSTTSLFLFDRADDSLTKIDGYDIATFYVAPGAVGDRYATWTVCGPLTCSVWWYDTQESEPRPRKLPTVDGRPQYAPVIDEVGGTIYFVRSRQGCGESVRVWRRAWPLDPDVDARRLVALPEGIDTNWTMSLDRDAAHQRVDLWFARYRCAGRQGDIVELRDVETLP
jgi:hypothetical protein